MTCKWHVSILVIMLNVEIGKSHVNITYVRFKMVVMRSPLLKYMNQDRSIAKCLGNRFEYDGT